MGALTCYTSDMIESVATMTQEDFNGLSADEQHRLHELYLEECRNSGIKGDLSQFLVWVEER